MDRQLKKVVKQDEFKEQVWHGVDFLTHHTADLKKYGAIALAVLLVAGGSYWFVRHQAETREEALAAALENQRCHRWCQPPGGEPALRHAGGKGSGHSEGLRRSGGEVSRHAGRRYRALNLGQAAADHGDLAGAEKVS